MRTACVTAILVLSVGTVSSSGQGMPWDVGDVFLAVGDGTYHVYNSQGGFKEAIEDELGGYTSDCGFNPSLDKLFTTNYTHTKVVVYDDAREHAVLERIDTSELSPGGHSGALVFDAEGGFFVGHPDGNNLIHKYDEAGLLVGTYDAEVEGRRGANWLDLAADQGTLYYTTEGRYILRYDTATNTQLPDFAKLPGEGNAQAVRLLPPGDGTEGLLVADATNIKRLDSSGAVVQVYDAPDRDGWFALNLDPNGTSFGCHDHRRMRGLNRTQSPACEVSWMTSGINSRRAIP